MYGLVGLFDSNYMSLAKHTWYNNKLLYSQKHGYKTFCKTDDFTHNVGYEKIYYVKDIFQNNPDIEWLWVTGTDSMITNFAVRIEDRIDNDYHFIITTDILGINADSFLIRNTAQGNLVLDTLISLEKECVSYWDNEQRAICLMLGVPVTGLPGANEEWKMSPFVNINSEFKDIAKIVPQRFMNSYLYKLYPYHSDNKDKLGIPGEWEKGDWLVHWPATQLEQRMHLAEYFHQQIVY